MRGIVDVPALGGLAEGLLAVVPLAVDALIVGKELNALRGAPLVRHAIDLHQRHRLAADSVRALQLVFEHALEEGLEALVGAIGARVRERQQHEVVVAEALLHLRLERLHFCS